VIRRELATAVADKLDLPAGTVHRVLDAALALLVDELLRAGRLEWRGLGTFNVRKYPPRRIHNPTTGRTIELPARSSVTFKPSTRIRSRLQPLARNSNKRRR
jgi:nucleoid DNA-binding protein